MSKRNRERRRVRQEQKQRAPTPGQEAEALAFMRNFEKAVESGGPAAYPGASDPTLARPDRVKLAFAEFALHKEPGRTKGRKLQHDLANGVLEGMPELNHWGMEDFFWHGVPGDPWHPLDAFLDSEKERLPPHACEQLRGWKQARIGFFEIGTVADDLITLRECDAVTHEPRSPDFRAISLNIGGVNFYRGLLDQIQLTY